MEEKKKKLEICIKSNEKVLQRLENNLMNNNIENNKALSAKINEIKNIIDTKKNKLEECNHESSQSIVKPGDKFSNNKNEVGSDKKGRKRNFKQKSFKTIEPKNDEKKKTVYIDNNYINYLKIEETIPEYMSKLLMKMPNNKGFVWRGIRLYGKLPRINNIVYLDERKAGEMFVHEITPTHTKLYRKNKNGTLGSMISSNIRKIKLPTK
jgi:hypothetical protein